MAKVNFLHKFFVPSKQPARRRMSETGQQSERGDETPSSRASERASERRAELTANLTVYKVPFPGFLPARLVTFALSLDRCCSIQISRPTFKWVVRWSKSAASVIMCDCFASIRRAAPRRAVPCR